MDKTKEGAQVAAQGSGDQNLQKALDDNLEKMNSLQKSSETIDIEEFLKSDENKAKVEAILKAQKNDNDDDDSDDDDDEYMKGKSKKMCGKMKKSIDSLADGNEELIDAMPMIGQLVDTLKSVQGTIEDLSLQFMDLKKSHNDSTELQNALCDVVKSSSEMIKSVQSDIESIGNLPQKRKGQISINDTIQKSFGEDQGQGEGEGNAMENHINMVKSFGKPALQNALIKSTEEGLITSDVASKWELSGYSSKYITPDIFAKISKNLPQKGVQN